MCKRLLVVQRGRKGAVKGFGKRVGVAGLLVEEEDACSVPGLRGRDLRSEPGACYFDAFERVAAVHVPRNVLLAADFAAAGPAHFFKTADEFWRKLFVVLGIVPAESHEVSIRNGYSEAGVVFLEVGGQAKLDALKRRVPVDDIELCRDLIRALLEHLNGSWRLRSCETRSAGLHYPTLMPCNFFNGVPQHSRVIDSQTRDASDGGLDEDVRTIVFTADAAFDYSGIDALAHVCMIRHKGQESEVDRLGCVVWRLALRFRCLL